MKWMVDGVHLEPGQRVLLIVEEELRQELEPAQIRLQQTEELNVTETGRTLRHATQTLVQWMVDGVNSEPGQNVLLIVEEELRKDLEPAQIRLQQTEGLTVTEVTTKPRTAIFGPAQVSI